MTPEQFQRHVNHGYSAEFHVIGWVTGQITGALDYLIMWLLIVAGGGVLLAGLMVALPTVVMFGYRKRIMEKLCPQYRRPEPGREVQR